MFPAQRAQQPPALRPKYTGPMDTSRQTGRARHSRRGFLIGPWASVAWLALGLFLLVAIIQIAMHFDRLSTRSIAQLLVIPITLASVVGLICWGIGRAVFYRNTIAGVIGFSVVLLLATGLRILVMTGFITGSMRGGNLRVNTPGATASNAPSTTPAPGANKPAPIMPNPVAANPAAPARPIPGGDPFPTPPSMHAGRSHDFAAVADQIAIDDPGAKDILLRHARDLKGLLEGFQGPANALQAALESPVTLDPAILRQHIATAQAAKDAGERYADRARGLRRQLENDLRAEGRLDPSAAPRIAGRFVTMTFAENRTFAIEQVTRAGDDLTRQSQMILDAPTKWTLDGKGNVETSDLSKLAEYRGLRAKLEAQRRMVKSAIERAMAP